jgi:hypothetical protein
VQQRFDVQPKPATDLGQLGTVGQRLNVVAFVQIGLHAFQVQREPIEIGLRARVQKLLFRKKLGVFAVVLLRVFW